MDDIAKIDYQTLQQDRSLALERELNRQLRSRQRDGISVMRRTILSYVVSSDYNKALNEIDQLVEMSSDYPGFEANAFVYIQHCKDIISAIKVKRDFKQIAHVSTSMQNDIFETIISHFEELKLYLKKIEFINTDEKLKDVRHTVWVIKTAAVCVTFLFGLACFLEFFNGGALTSFLLVSSDFANKFIDFIL